MKRTWRIAALLLITLVVAGIGYLTTFTEPVHEGRPLSDWLTQLQAPTKEARDEARQAVKAIGAEAIPHLVWWIGDEDNELEKRLRKLLDQQSWLNYKGTTARARRTRARIAFGILDSDAAPAVPALNSLLSHSNSDVREASAWALGDIGRDAHRAVPHLIRLTNHGDDDVREAAAVALGKVATPSDKVVKAVAGLLDKDSPRITGAAAEALFHWGPKAEEAIPDLIELVKQRRSSPRGGENSEVFHLSIARGSSRSLAGIIGKIGAGRREAFCFLASLGSPVQEYRRVRKALEQWLNHSSKSVPVLMDIIRDETIPTNDRNDAVRLMPEVNQPTRIAEFLIGLLDDKAVRTAAVRTLPELKGSAEFTAPILLDRLAEVTPADSEFAQDLLYALQRLDVSPRHAIPIYMRLAHLDFSVFSHRLESPKASVARRAYRNLKALFRSPKTLETLLVLRLDDPSDWRIRATAVAGLKKQETISEQTIEILKQAVNDANPWVRFYASVTLTDNGVFDPPVLEALFDGIADRSLPAELRAGAIYHLGRFVPKRIPPDKPVRQLITSLDAPNVKVRAAAVRVLGTIGKPAAPAVPKLIALLDDSEGQHLGKTHYPVRAFAAQALGRIGAKAQKAIPILQQLASSGRQPTRKLAKTGLQQIQSSTSTQLFTH